MDRADCREYGQHGPGGDSDEPDPMPTSSAAPGVAPKSAGDVRSIRHLPGGDIECGAHRVRVGVDHCECSIEFDADACRRAVKDCRDFRVRDSLEAAQHHDSPLQLSRLAYVTTTT